MSSMTVLLKRHSLTVYFALVFVISWGAVLLVAGPEGFPLNAAQFESFGALMYLAMIAGPGVAGIAMIAVTDGRSGLRQMLARLRRFPRGASAYAVALLPALVMTAATLVLSLVPELRPAIFDSSDKGAILAAAILPSLMVGALEEIGWTGFAVPRMRLRHSAIATGLTVGVVWGAWHLPLFYEADSLSGGIAFSLLLARLFSWLPPLRVLMVWLHDHTESIPIVMLMHAMVSYVAITLAPEGLTSVRLLTIVLTSAAAMWLLVAVFALVRPSWARAPQDLVVSA